MSIPQSLQERFTGAIGESSTPNVPAVRVMNPDGTDIAGGGGGTQDTNLIELAGNPVDVGAGAVGTGTQRTTLASDDPLVASTGDSSDAAATAGSIGTLQAKLRLATSQLDAIKTSVETIDNIVSGSSAQTVGNVAHDAVDAGNPVKVGFKAKSFDGTEPGTAVAEDDRVDAIADPYGRQYINDMHPRFWHTSADYGAAQTNASIKAAPGASLKLYITDIAISNGATAGNVTLLDGSGGTVLFEHYPGVNGGIVCNLRNPIVLTANTALCITSTTVTTHSVNIGGFIAP